ncbi:hypothetical protein KGF56_004307 [Candida oxycetoniae]|uniref:Uncharacterized protein n=1 Tax=Candida oxycetoniae TaxID=497107 RepID=A0AAI9SU03_9ASCO|nr:uncharacterized protein KGF56_004307 [Candida oxycetoniae]KAI3402846.1 hypothetical protein KGF56_004307 [Candida oxycetoniae]
MSAENSNSGSGNEKAPQENTSASPELNQEDLHKIQNITEKILNPNGENPQTNEYIKATFSYIGNALKKMQDTDDRDATAKEIADDLTSKFESWAATKKKEEEEKRLKSEEKRQDN